MPLNSIAFEPAGGSDDGPGVARGPEGQRAVGPSRARPRGRGSRSPRAEGPLWLVCGRKSAPGARRRRRPPEPVNRQWPSAAGRGAARSAEATTVTDRIGVDVGQCLSRQRRNVAGAVHGTFRRRFGPIKI